MHWDKINYEISDWNVLIFDLLIMTHAAWTFESSNNFFFF